MVPRSQHICMQIPRSTGWEKKRQPTVKLTSLSHYERIAGRLRPGLKLQNTQIRNPGDMKKAWHPMPLVLHVITWNPTRELGHAQLGAFEYVVLNPMSKTGSVLMKKHFVLWGLQHYLLLWSPTDALKGTQAGHLFRGSAFQMSGNSPEATTPLRPGLNFATAQRTGVQPPQNVLHFPFLGAMLGSAITFQQ